jgi:hypothetical protein
MQRALSHEPPRAGSAARAAACARARHGDAAPRAGPAQTAARRARARGRLREAAAASRAPTPRAARAPRPARARTGGHSALMSPPASRRPSRRSIDSRSPLPGSRAGPGSAAKVEREPRRGDPGAADMAAARGAGGRADAAGGGRGSGGYRGAGAALRGRGSSAGGGGDAGAGRVYRRR